MSIRAIGIVLEAAIAPPTNKLAAVVLADWCNDEGGSLYPSMKKIAAKVGVSRSQAQRIVHGFVEQGLLSVIANGDGGKPGMTPRYQLHLDRISALDETGRMDATGSTHATGSVGAQDGSHGCTGGVAPMHKTGSTHATLTVIDPLENQEKKRARAPRASSKPSKTPLASDFGVSERVRGWASEKGLDRLDEHLEHFIGSAKANGYRYIDWDQAFMNAIRADWAKLRGRPVARSAGRVALSADEVFTGGAR